MKINVVIVGYGYWGPKLARNFRKNPACGLLEIYEIDSVRTAKANREYSGLRHFESFEGVLKDPNIHAVALATPVSTHYPLAKQALLAGKHVLIEKPMALSLLEARELSDLATKQKLVLMVDHTFVYHAAVQKIKEIMDEGVIGKLQYIDSTRINLGIFQHDVNVLWDLAVHDISIINYLTGQTPKTVQAIGTCHTENSIENIGYLIMRYESGLLAHINCSWISPVKLRQTLIGGDKKMIVYNDLDANEPVKIYDSSFRAKTDDDIKRLLYECRVGDVFSPRIKTKEALEGVIEDFLLSILNRQTPISDGKFGMQVIGILEAAQKSIKNQGEVVSITDFQEVGQS